MLKRLMHHLFTTKRDGREAFPSASLHAIQTKIAEGEKRHRAEIRLIIEPALLWLDVMQKQSSRQRARALFSLYRIWDTEENCGILVYINLADRKVEIVTDRAVGRVLSAAEWQALCKTMTKGFANREFEVSTLAALQQLNDLLATRFPATGKQANELSNRPLIV